jgi:hypothetical protein
MTDLMLDKIETDLSLLKWMVGTNVAITLVVLAFVLRGALPASGVGG